MIDRRRVLPVPGITHLEGKVLTRVRDALHDPARAEPRAVPRRLRRRSLDDPNRES